MSSQTSRPSRYFVGRLRGVTFLGIEFDEGRAPIRHAWRDGARIVWVRADQRDEVVDLASTAEGQLALWAFAGPAGLEVVQFEQLGADGFSATTKRAFVVRDRLASLRRELLAIEGSSLDRIETALDAQRMRGFVGGLSERPAVGAWADSPRQRELLRQAWNEADRAGVSLAWISAERAQPAAVRLEIERRQEAVGMHARVVDERIAHAEGAARPAGPGMPAAAGNSRLEHVGDALSSEEVSRALQKLQRDNGLTQEGLERLMTMSEARTGAQIPDLAEIGRLIQRMEQNDRSDEVPREPRPRAC